MTAPERICIHIERYEDHAQYDPYWQIPHGADYEVGYIRHDAAALAASPVVQDMIRQAVEAALGDVTTLHRVIADIRMATVGSKPMLSELAAALVGWRDEAVEAEWEACAGLADDSANWYAEGAAKALNPTQKYTDERMKSASDAIAAAIRARKGE